MIGIGDRERRADSVQAHRLEFKRTQRPRSVVQQDLVDPQGDLAPWLQVATGQMATDQLTGQVVSHGEPLSTIASLPSSVSSIRKNRWAPQPSRPCSPTAKPNISASGRPRSLP